MTGQWCYWKNHFTKDKCLEIQQQAMLVPDQPATVGYNNGFNVNHQIRKSRIRWIKKEGFWIEIYEELEKMTKKSNDDWFDVRYNYLPPLQFTEYDSAYEGEYKMHQDVMWPSKGDTERKISFVIQISDPEQYQGGDLQFHHVSAVPDPVEIKSQGTVIFFPSLVHHQLTPVTRGVRYSLVGWWEGPNWR